MGTYVIQENGQSGEVVVEDDRIVRTRKDALGRDEVETIPIAPVNGVHVDRKTFSTDEVTLQVGLVAYRWKVKRANDLLAEVHRIRFVTSTLPGRETD